MSVFYVSPTNHQSVYLFLFTEQLSVYLNIYLEPSVGIRAQAHFPPRLLRSNYNWHPKLSKRPTVQGLFGSRANGKRVNSKIFAPVTSDVWTLIRSIKYNLIKKLIT
jgi:hypothetical protein